MNTPKNFYTVEVVGWNKHNEKMNGKPASWFRLSANLFNDHEFLTLSAGAKFVWLFICCQRALSNPKPCRVSTRHVSSLCHIKPQSVPKALFELEERQWIQILDAPSSRARAVRTDVTDVTNGRDETDETDIVPSAPAVKKESPEKKSHWLVDMWNEFGAKLPKAHIPISSARLKKIQTRIKDRPDPELWKAAIVRLAESNFANGLNDRAWVAGFDFILQADSLDKILEGKYDNRRAVTQKERQSIEQAQRLLGNSEI
jgi:hypothetical protein